MNKSIKNKKAQEEVMGFVIIVLIVMVIGLVFFAFALRRTTDTAEEKDAELDDLLQAMSYYTTDCKINSQYLNIKELVRKCYVSETANCENSEKVCVALNSTLEDMLQEFLGQNMANQVIHSYSLNISNSKQITYIEEGNLEGNYIGSSVPIPTLTGTDVNIYLRFYYS